jgi:hypothetical protein
VSRIGELGATLAVTAKGKKTTRLTKT